MENAVLSADAKDVLTMTNMKTLDNLSYKKPNKYIPMLLTQSSSQSTEKPCSKRVATARVIAITTIVGARRAVSNAPLIAVVQAALTAR